MVKAFLMGIENSPSFYHLVINKKKVYRLCKQEGLLKPQRKLKNKHPRKVARNRIVTGSNQLWETDIKYGYIHGENRFFSYYPLLMFMINDSGGRVCSGTA